MCQYNQPSLCSADTDEELCMALARWGRGSAQKRQMSYPPAGPSAHRPAEAGVSGSDPQRASSSSTPETGQSDSEPVLHVASSPIAEFERTKVFVRDSYKDIFLRIWRRMLLWIKSNEAEADASTSTALSGEISMKLFTYQFVFSMRFPFFVQRKNYLVSCKKHAAITLSMRVTMILLIVVFLSYYWKVCDLMQFRIFVLICSKRKLAALANICMTFQ